MSDRWPMPEEEGWAFWRGMPVTPAALNALAKLDASERDKIAPLLREATEQALRDDEIPDDA